MKTTTTNGRGFTLIEVVIASVIGAFITIVIVGTLRTVAAARQSTDAVTSITDELRYTAGAIRRDFANLYRDRDIERMRLVGQVEETPYGIATSLSMWIISPVPARRGQPEGDIYEVQYYLSRNETGNVLTRRLCPILNVARDSEEYVENNGGMLTVIAENIVDFQVQYHDGYEWLDQWPEEQQVLPEMVEIVLTGCLPGDGDGERPIIKNMVVTFPRISERLKAQLDEDAENDFENISSMDAD